MSNVDLVYQAGVRDGGSSGFDILEETMTHPGTSNVTSLGEWWTVNAPSGARLIMVNASEEAFVAAKELAKANNKYYSPSFLFAPGLQLAGTAEAGVPNRCGFETVVLPNGSISFTATDGIDNGDNTFSIKGFNFAPGEYYWKAYYWNE